MVNTCFEERGFAGVRRKPAENYKFHTSDRRQFFREQGSERK